MTRKIALSMFAMAALLTGCGGGAHKKEAAERPPVAVKVETASFAEWPALYEATGTVTARTTAVVASRVMGYVRQVGFQAGDRVRKGQLLVEIDSRDLETGVRQAEAARREAEEALQEVEGAIATAKANLELAEATFRRMEDLYQKKSISTQEFDEASARLKVARAGYEMAAAKRKQVSARVSQASEGVAAAGIMREFTRVTAPFDGVVTEKRVEAGDLASPGMPLAVIEQPGAYRLEASVEESRIGNIRAGQPVTVTLDALGRTLEARVSEIMPAADPASRTNIVRINLPDLAGLRSGLFGRAAFALGQRKVLSVPAGAIVEQGQLRSVLVAENGYARARLIVVGDARQDRREVLSGLSEGDRYIFPVPPGLTDGARVEARP